MFHIIYMLIEDIISDEGREECLRAGLGLLLDSPSWHDFIADGDSVRLSNGQTIKALNK